MAWVGLLGATAGITWAVWWITRELDANLSRHIDRAFKEVDKRDRFNRAFRESDDLAWIRQLGVELPVYPNVALDRTDEEYACRCRACLAARSFLANPGVYDQESDE